MKELHKPKPLTKAEQTYLNALRKSRPELRFNDIEGKVRENQYEQLRQSQDNATLSQEYISDWIERK